MLMINDSSKSQSRVELTRQQQGRRQSRYLKSEFAWGAGAGVSANAHAEVEEVEEGEEGGEGGEGGEGEGGDVER